MAIKQLKNTDTGEVRFADDASAAYHALVDAHSTGKYHKVGETDSAASGWTDIGAAGSGGGSAAQVFEVTNLTIPAGTDWSVDAHSIGSADVPTGRGVLVIAFIEFAQLTAPDDVRLRLIEGPVSAGFTGLVLEASAAYLWGATTDATQVTGWNGASETEALAPTIPWRAELHTPSGPTTADITIVRARLAFSLT